MDLLFQNPSFFASYIALSLGLSFFRKWSVTKVLYLFLNVSFAYLLFFSTEKKNLVEVFGGYLAYVVLILILIYGATKTRHHQMAAWIPVIGFILLHFGPFVTFADIAVWISSAAVPWIARSGALQAPVLWVGLSYMTFRLSLLALEIQNQPTTRKSFWQFLIYAFDPKTLIVGPINSFIAYREFIENQTFRNLEVLWQSVLRIAVGFFKFYFISGLFYQMTLSRTWHGNSPLSWEHLGLAIFSYTIYIYMNFSGFCDVIIGLGALTGLEIKENFNNPLLAKNIRQFWQSWHISLTDYLNMMIFNPLSKWVLRSKWAPLYSWFVPGISAVVLTTMGLWHGLQWNYLFFAWIHAFGLTVHHLWRKSFPHSKQTQVKNFFSWLVTFCFISVAFFFFENSAERIEQIVRALP